jgi:hypothetical protein
MVAGMAAQEARRTGAGMIKTLLIIAAILLVMRSTFFLRTPKSTRTCKDPGCTCTGLPDDETHL